MLGISAALCPLMSVSSISSSPLALKDSWVIEKKNLLGSFFPYLAHSSFIHNYSRVIYSQDIRIPDLRWHRHFVGDTQVGAEQHGFAWSSEQLFWKCQYSLSVQDTAPSCRQAVAASTGASAWMNHSTAAAALPVTSTTAKLWVKLSGCGSTTKHCAAPSAFNGSAEGHRG